MIGFDRPLRPLWIYETLKTVKEGKPISDYNSIFEDIARELTGKEGKRKVRTVLFRSFIYLAREKTKTVKNSFLMKWANKYSAKALTPIFFAKLLMDYEVLRFVSIRIASFVDSKGHINTKHFMNKFIQEYGDRDIVRRSLRAFFATLEHFNLANNVSVTEIELLEKYKLSVEQTKMFLQLYSFSFIKSKMIDLKQLDKAILWYYPEMPIQATAREFHGKEWEYIREPARELLLLK